MSPVLEQLLLKKYIREFQVALCFTTNVDFVKYMISSQTFQTENVGISLFLVSNRVCVYKTTVLDTFRRIN